jgi:hypothetical protein
VDTGARRHPAGGPNLIVLPVRRSLHGAHVLSLGVLVIGSAAGAAGLFGPATYEDAAWVREALRGGDLVTLFVAMPVLALSLLASARGSRRARPVWLGCLGYVAYANAFRMFGAEFNDVFPLHIAAASLSVSALLAARPNLDLGAIVEPIRSSQAVPWVGALLVIAGVAQAALRIVVLTRLVDGRSMLDHVPVDAHHVMCALELGVLVPLMLFAGVSMFRRSAVGLMVGTAVCVMAALHQIALLAAGLFQAGAGASDVPAFPIWGVFLAVVFCAAALALVLAPAGPVPSNATQPARRAG